MASGAVQDVVGGYFSLRKWVRRVYDGNHAPLAVRAGSRRWSGTSHGGGKDVLGTLKKFTDLVFRQLRCVGHGNS